MSAPLGYPLFHAFTPSGAPGAGYKVFSYAAGSSTPQATYTTSEGTVANANPVILDANGEAQIWLANTLYKIVLKTNLDVTLWTIDNVSGAGAGGTIVSPSAAFPGEWVSFGFTPTYVSPTSFRVAGDYTGQGQFQIGRRLLTINTSGVLYSTVLSATLVGANTVVTVRNDLAPLDAGLSEISYGILAARGGSVPVWSRVAVSQPATGNLSSGVAVVPFTTGVTEYADWLDEFAAGVFTARVSGAYHVVCRITFLEGTALTGAIGQVSINGPSGEVFVTQTAAQSDTTQTAWPPVNLTATFLLTAGQSFSMAAKFTFSGGTVSIASGDLFIDRID